MKNATCSAAWTSLDLDDLDRVCGGAESKSPVSPTTAAGFGLAIYASAVETGAKAVFGDAAASVLGAVHGVTGAVGGTVLDLGENGLPQNENDAGSLFMKGAIDTGLAFAGPVGVGAAVALDGPIGHFADMLTDGHRYDSGPPAVPNDELPFEHAGITPMAGGDYYSGGPAPAPADPPLLDTSHESHAGDGVEHLAGNDYYSGGDGSVPPHADAHPADAGPHDDHASAAAPAPDTNGFSTDPNSYSNPTEAHVDPSTSGGADLGGADLGGADAGAGL